MAIIKGYIDPYWHESYLMILILNQGHLKKNELFEKITQEQKKRTVLGEKEVTHSESAYRYWLKKHQNHWIINDYGDTLELTPLGKWMANSRLGSFFDRENFIGLICSKCARPGDLVVLKLLPDTAETNAKGRLFMDVECPRCHYSEKRVPLSEALSQNEFTKFYNKALTELQKIVKVVG